MGTPIPFTILDNMRQLVIIASVLGLTLGMPQGAPRQQLVQDDSARGSENLFTKIISLKTKQEGAEFGHSLAQEDGTGSGVRIGEDGLQYGFYTYIGDDGNRVRVNWRAGEGVGYEVLSTEGLNTETLGNLRATQNATPDPFYVERPHVGVTANPNQFHNPVIIHQEDQPIPVNTFRPTLVGDINFLPNQFDYASQLNVERSNLGFKSQFKATK